MEIRCCSVGALATNALATPRAGAVLQTERFTLSLAPVTKVVDVDVVPSGEATTVKEVRGAPSWGVRDHQQSSVEPG
jgi:hypothetical protein